MTSPGKDDKVIIEDVDSNEEDSDMEVKGGGEEEAAREEEDSAKNITPTTGKEREEGSGEPSDNSRKNEGLVDKMRRQLGEWKATHGFAKDDDWIEEDKGDKGKQKKREDKDDDPFTTNSEKKTTRPTKTPEPQEIMDLIFCAIDDAYKQDLEQVDIDRATNLSCDMVLLNPTIYTQEEVEKLVGTSVTGLDFSIGFGGNTMALFFKIQGTIAADKARKVVKQAKTGMILVHRQATDNYEKLRNVALWGAPKDVPNISIDAWKADVVKGMEPYGKLVEVMVSRKGFVSVTFEDPVVARHFESNPQLIKVDRFHLKARRVPVPVVKNPADVVIDGFCSQDKAVVILAVTAGTRRFTRFQFINKGSGLAAVVTFRKYREAAEFVAEGAIEVKKEGSNLKCTLSVMWAKDFNTRRQQTDMGGGSANKNSTNDEAISLLKEEIKDCRKEAAEHFADMEKRRKKDRRDDINLIAQAFMDNQTGLLRTMQHSMNELTMRMGDVHRHSTIVSDAKMERMYASMTISKLLRVKDRDQALEDELAALQKQRAEAVETISKGQAAVESILSRPVELLALEGSASPLFPRMIEGVEGLPATSKRGKRKREAHNDVLPDENTLTALWLDMQTAKDKAEAASSAWIKAIAGDLGATICHKGNKWCFVDDKAPIFERYRALTIAKSFVVACNGQNAGKLAAQMLNDLSEEAVAEWKKATSRNMKNADSNVVIIEADEEAEPSRKKGCSVAERAGGSKA